MTRAGHVRRIACIGVWGALLALAVLLDAPVSAWVRGHPLSGNALFAAHAVRDMGNFFFTIALGLLVLGLTRGNVRAAFLPCLAGAIGGICYEVLKRCVGRPRPNLGAGPFEFHPFTMHSAGLSFPSGHTCLAFATAAALAVSFPRARVAFFFVAALVAAERVREGAHYPSDVVGGAAVGVVSALIAARLWPLQARRTSP